MRIKNSVIFHIVKPNESYHFISYNKDNFIKINDLYSSNLYINGGYFFSGNFILDYLKPNKEFVTDILPEVSKKNKVKVIKHEGFWHSLENYKDYLKIKKYFKHGI